MKVVHIGAFDRVGGACIAAYRQHQALLAEGVDSRMLVQSKVTDDPRVILPMPHKSTKAKLRRRIRRHYLNYRRYHASPRGELFDFRSEHQNIDLSAVESADVINIQFSQEFLDHPSFFANLPKTKPVVVTLHEMSNFTGGCSYSWDCKRFEFECGNCPQLNNPNTNDLSRIGWRLRNAAFSNHRKLHFVADSRWLADQAKKSSLLKEHRVEVVHYGIDGSIFNPIEQSTARAALQIPQNSPVVGFAAASVSDKRKGIELLAGAIEKLSPPPFLLTWGHNIPHQLSHLPHQHLGHLSNERLSALAYSSLDVFVMPSLEEAFGQTALEALSCGTPVVSFDVGGLRDMIEPGKNGAMVEKGNIDLMADSVRKILTDTNLMKQWRSQGNHWVADRFSFARNASSYLKIYQSMLEE